MLSLDVFFFFFPFVLSCQLLGFSRCYKFLSSLVFELNANI